VAPLAGAAAQGQRPARQGSGTEHAIRAKEPPAPGPSPLLLTVLPNEPEDAGCRNDSGPISGGTDDYQTCSRRAGRALGKFLGIWDITSWPQYWATQYSWLNGHQPWLSSPSFVVQVWASGYGSASVVRQVRANTFKVTKPDGKTFTVTGARPVSVPGPWVITSIT